MRLLQIKVLLAADLPHEKVVVEQCDNHKMLFDQAQLHIL